MEQRPFYGKLGMAILENVEADAPAHKFKVPVFIRNRVGWERKKSILSLDDCPPYLCDKIMLDPLKTERRYIWKP